jgi:Zn-dependent protease
MNFLNGAVRLGRLFGIDIHIHILYLLWVAFNLLSAGGSWKLELLFYAMLFGIILVHELGHCFGARAVGGYAQQILMWPLGGLAFAHAPMRPWPQFVTVACGPLVNVVFCLVSAAVLIAVSGATDIFSLNPLGWTVFLPADAPPWLDYVAVFYHVNFYLLAFNLLPIYPMDGGQLLLTVLWPFIGLRRATLLACQVGLAGAFGLGAWALMRMRSDGGGPGGSILLLIAIMGAMTCWQRLQMARMGLLMDERIGTVEHVRRQRGGRGGGFWSRLFQRGGAHGRAAQRNPNPGGWEKKAAEEERLDADVDRILQKVHTHGMQSLTYIERQTLERASRRRQQQDGELDGRE